MGYSVWCLISALLVASIKAELHENVAESFYEKPESSSPAPSRLTGMKELVLYLTPDQAQVLEAAGAIVQPFPEFEHLFLQHKYKQPVEEQTEPQYEAAPETPKPTDMELDEYYKVLNIQQINEDLTTKTKPPVPITEKPRPKYKYNPKQWQQEYAANYVPKKTNKTKSTSTEYVRYLPNYEFEDLKMETFRAMPLPGYRFEDIPANIHHQTYLQIPKDIKIPEITEPVTVSPIQTLTTETIPTQQPTMSPEEAQFNMKDKGPVTFGVKVPVTVNTQAPAYLWPPLQKHKSSAIKAPVSFQAPSESQVPTNIASPISKHIDIPPAPTPAPLLAPLLQHEKITESIAEQKKELENHERAIQNKLEKLKQSGSHENIETRYAIELDKLNKNLGQQNILSQKLAFEAITKKPEVPVQKEETPSKSRPPIDLVNNSMIPVLVQVPQPLGYGGPQLYPVPLQTGGPVTVPLQAAGPLSVPLKTAGPIPVPVLIDKIEVGKTLPLTLEKRVPIPTRNVYLKPDKPYLLPKAAPVEIKHEFPVKFPNYQSDKLTVIRHIWEH